MYVDILYIYICVRVVEEVQNKRKNAPSLKLPHQSFN